MRGLSPEQVLMLADDFCGTCNATINDFAAIAAIAAVTTASFEGTSPFPHLRSSRNISDLLSPKYPHSPEATNLSEYSFLEY